MQSSPSSKLGQIPEMIKLKSPILLIGPAYCGKSELAPEALNMGQKALVIGTASLEDESLQKRIRALQESRPSHWQLVESPGEVVESLKKGLGEHTQILIDSINQWIAYRLVSLLHKQDLTQSEDAILEDARQLAAMVKAQHQQTNRLILVSSETGAGVHPPLPVAASFRRLTCQVNHMLAKNCLSVVSMQAGIPMIMKSS